MNMNKYVSVTPPASIAPSIADSITPSMSSLQEDSTNYLSYIKSLAQGFSGRFVALNDLLEKSQTISAFNIKIVECNDGLHHVVGIDDVDSLLEYMDHSGTVPVLRVLLTDNLTPELISILGAKLNIDPRFWNDHLTRDEYSDEPTSLREERLDMYTRVDIHRNSKLERMSMHIVENFIVVVCDADGSGRTSMLPTILQYLLKSTIARDTNALSHFAATIVDCVVAECLRQLNTIKQTVVELDARPRWSKTKIDDLLVQKGGTLRTAEGLEDLIKLLGQNSETLQTVKTFAWQGRATEELLEDMKWKLIYQHVNAEKTFKRQLWKYGVLGSTILLVLGTSVGCLFVLRESS